ncbi:MAG TPA: hypothetical protein VF883_07335 [Thermoanaerobaculia bacterium]
MRNILLALAVLVVCTFAFEAAACSRCGTTPEACDYCYESSGDGAQGCYLTNGEWCTLIDPGTCEGWDGSCEGARCTLDLEALRAEPAREWRLASYEVIRPTEPKSSS